MTTDTFYSNLSARIESEDNTYTTARSGASLLTISDPPRVGQFFDDPNNEIWESFFNFDTSGLVGATVSAATFSLFARTEQANENFVLEARTEEFGVSITSADWVAGADLGSSTLIAKFENADTVSEVSYTDFVSEAAMLAAIITNGDTKIMVNSSRHREGNAPTGFERIIWESEAAAGTDEDPKLVVTHTHLVLGGSSMAGGEQTLSGGMA